MSSISATSLKLNNAIVTTNATSSSVINLPSQTKLNGSVIPNTNIKSNTNILSVVPSEKKTLSYSSSVSLKDNNIYASVDSYGDNSSTYTFGPSIPNRMIAVGSGTNTMATSTDGINWMGIPATPFSTAGYCAEWNGNIWVAGGAGTNTIAYSYDGIVWTGSANGNSIFTTACNDVAWNGEIWVAVGSGTNTIAYSNDGINWTAASSTFNSEGRGVAWNGELWVAVGDKPGVSTLPTIIWSTDGDTWSNITGGGFANYGNTVLWNGTNWIAGGNSGNNETIRTSTDGKDWPSYQGTDRFSTNAYDFAWNGEMVVGVGEGGRTLVYSKNYGTSTVTGEAWIEVPNFNLIFSTAGRGIIWNGTMWIACGNGTNTLAYSYDGLNWTGVANSTSIFTTQCNKVAWNGRRRHQMKFQRPMAVAIDARSGGLAYSYDGTNWANSANITITAGNSIETDGHIWVAGVNGDNSIIYSYDGITWTGIEDNVILGHCMVVRWNGSIWVAGGTGAGSTLAYSYDGINWFGLGDSIFSDRCDALAWNGNMWLASGDSNNYLAYSYDGINWIGLGTTDLNPYTYLVYFNNVWIGTSTANTNPKFEYSFDGFEWKRINGLQFGGTSFNNKLWLTTLINNNKVLRYSYDGVTGWRSLSNPPSMNNSNDVTWFKDKWIVGGTGNNSLAYSYDGQTWINNGNGGANNLNDTNRVKANTNINNIKINILNPMVSLGSGTHHTIGYSDDGMKWTGLGKTIFSTSGHTACWNGTMWIAGGEGTNTLAYSYDGLNWTGLGTSVFSTRCKGISWNGTIWVAVGAGTNTIAWSTNGIGWRGLGTSIFSTSGHGVAWNGTEWRAVGEGTNTIAKSTNGNIWTTSQSNTFSTAGYGITFVPNDLTWVAVGEDAASIKHCLYSEDTWENATSNPFTTSGYGIAFNGSMLVAVGAGTNTMAYSTDTGDNWTNITSSGEFTTKGYSVAWNSKFWIAAGEGTNELLYSYNGTDWYPEINTNPIFGTNARGVAGNSKIGPPAVPSQMAVLKNNNINNKAEIDIVADTYYEKSSNKLSVAMMVNNL